MKAVYIQRGEAIDYKNSTLELIAVGDVVALKNRIGVAGDDIPAGTSGTLHLQGVYELEADSSAVFEVGQIVYLVDGKITAEGEIVAGMVVMPKSASGTKVRVKID
ncbi:DUF2190 family protein [Rummeliibacillus stabekisii]|uniref:DUF2190 family protein n=1 Tax=Rummeliibacillus stabekisii TaxID=241244 RepID=A0A143HC20_9BACL|nr:DUF2190 family protein [Rummeliibacillus stabekisii]AMW99317.1 hypothetical protein ATY39_07460 [Rummeliibacillus stabekisii]